MNIGSCMDAMQRVDVHSVSAGKNDVWGIRIAAACGHPHQYHVKKSVRDLKAMQSSARSKGGVLQLQERLGVA